MGNRRAQLFLTMNTQILFLICGLIGSSVAATRKHNKLPTTLRPRFVDSFSTSFMTEEIEGVPTTTAAAPECKGSLGWVYYNGHCYMFTSYHVDYLKAEELCNQEGAYLADVLDQINPKDGTDYWLGGLDADRNKGLQWMTGAPMDFNDFIQDEPKGNLYLHMNFDNQFAWDTKNDADDKDNGFICKKKL